MFNPMQAAKELTRQRNQTKTTVIQIEEYQIDTEDPKKSRIIGLDMFNKDENGVPKRVEVKHLNDKTNGINEFANPSALMYTAVGGLVRLSQYRVDGSGAYMANHMQRIARDSGPKVSGSQDKFDIHYMKGWTKIYPKRDRANNNALQIFDRGGRLFHRADVMVVPDDAPVTEMNFGSDTFEKELDEALNKAIDMAPKGAQPMIVVRMKGQLNADEIRLSHYRLDAERKPVPLTKEEIIKNAKENSELATSYIPSHRQAKDAGQVGQCEFVAGFALNAIGLKWDGRSKQKNPQTGEDEPRYNERSLIENFISETAQRHALPRVEGENKTKYVLDNGAPQYSFGILSYRTKQVPDGAFTQSDLDTFGRDHGVKLRVSPNAGLDEKPNPYAPKPAPTQAAAQAPTTTHEAAASQTPAESRSQTAAQAPSAEQTAAASQPAPQAAQPAASQPAPATEPTEVVEEVDDAVAEQSDFGLEDFDEGAFDVDMDDIEEQLASQSL